MTPFLRRLLNRAARLDERLRGRGRTRRILVDARTPVNFTMVAPVFHAISRDPRIEFFFTASETPAEIKKIYQQAGSVRLIHPLRAAMMRFDAYLTSDFMWATLLRPAVRIQVFHGVAGKYGFDSPDSSMRDWDRLFFVNERRWHNFVGSGAISANSPAIRLVGMPKVDCLVNGTFERDAVIRDLGLDPALPTVLYAPTWSPASSLNAIGAELVQALGRMRINVILKLHDRSRDLRDRYSGGVDWPARLQPLLAPLKGVLAPGHDISPYLVAADVMITDHSSAGFEYLLCDKPIVRIHRAELIAQAKIHPDYVALLASVARTAETLPEVISAVEYALTHPSEQSADRRRVAAEMFYKPGGATARSVRELYAALELAPAADVLAGLHDPEDEERWQKSA
jgi:hypothetical protein